MYTPENIARLINTNPTIFSLLKDAQTPKMGRHFLKIYFDELTSILSRDVTQKQSLEWEIQMRCLSQLKRIISIRSERLANFSLIKILWMLANNKLDKLPKDLSDGFFEELVHLLKGATGESRIYEKESFPKFAVLSGREAAISRSAKLDTMTKKCNNFIQKYRTGLDNNSKKIRQDNKLRIMKYYNATEDEWNDHLWQIRHVVRTAEELSKLVTLTDEELDAINLAKKNGLPFGITPYYVSLMDQEPSRVNDHAIRAQVIPPLNYVETMIKNRGDECHSFDFMLENETSPADLITRRYPMICILKPYNTCSQICVYCQRNWEIDDVLYQDAVASKEKILAAIQWIKEHPAISDVLVTGGDPLVMQDKRLDFILSELAKIDHVDCIRIGSRTPVVLPQRITNDLIKIISKYHEPGRREILLVTHFVHPYEITQESLEAVQKFKKSGISVYNQAVFTVENSRRFELVSLRKNLRLIGVDPYYTFNTKGKEETKNYRVPLARLQQEIKEEARLVPGTMRTDEPVYNVPKLGKNYIRAQQHHSLLSILPNGQRVYEFHPWEKYLSLADTYVDLDVSIHDYLQELKRRGENINDYKSIWYYF